MSLTRWPVAEGVVPLVEDADIVTRRGLLHGGGALALGISSTVLPAAAAALSGGSAPDPNGAQFYLFRRSDSQVSVGWARAPEEAPFTYDITFELVPRQVDTTVTVSAEATLEFASSEFDSRFWVISSLWTGSFLATGSVVQATLVSNTSPSTTVVLRRAWPMGAGDPLEMSA